MLICLKIMDEQGELDQREVRFMMTGGTSVDLKRPNPTGEGGWMSDKIWASILQVSEEFEVFKGLDESIELYLDDWEKVYNLQQPQDEAHNWPSPFNNLSYIQQCIFLRIFRPDKVVPVI